MSNVVSAMTFTSGSSLMRCPVASIPFIRGICMSMSTTCGAWSGRICCARATAFSPSPASAVIVRPAFSRIILKPLRTSSWSSTSITRRGAAELIAPPGGAQHGS